MIKKLFFLAFFAMFLTSLYAAEGISGDYYVVPLSSLGENDWDEINTHCSTSQLDVNINNDEVLLAPPPLPSLRFRRWISGFRESKNGKIVSANGEGYQFQPYVITIEQEIDLSAVGEFRKLIRKNIDAKYVYVAQRAKLIHLGDQSSLEACFSFLKSDSEELLSFLGDHAHENGEFDNNFSDCENRSPKAPNWLKVRLLSDEDENDSEG